mmetsp:Transcript_57803/g.102639  ORF Transcript_57803/g.102639 Transcript_57803/m.102639 type:complete len:220 (+) Transcript_57803:840-1499(+)
MPFSQAWQQWVACQVAWKGHPAEAHGRSSLSMSSAFRLPLRWPFPLPHMPWPDTPLPNMPLPHMPLPGIMMHSNSWSAHWPLLMLFFLVKHSPQRSKFSRVLHLKRGPLMGEASQPSQTTWVCSIIWAAHGMNCISCCTFSHPELQKSSKKVICCSKGSASSPVSSDSGNCPADDASPAKKASRNLPECWRLSVFCNRSFKDSRISRSWGTIVMAACKV